MKLVTISDAVNASGLTFTNSQRKSMGVIALLTARKKQITPAKTAELINDKIIDVNGYPESFLGTLTYICKKFHENPVFKKKKKPKKGKRGKFSKPFKKPVYRGKPKAPASNSTSAPSNNPTN